MKAECSKKVVGYKLKNLRASKNDSGFLRDGSFVFSRHDAEIYPISFVKNEIKKLRDYEDILGKPYGYHFKIRLFAVWGER